MPPPSLLKGRAKVAEFYSASCGTIPPLPWQTFPPLFSPLQPPLIKIVPVATPGLRMSRSELASRLGYRDIGKGHAALAKALATGTVPPHMAKHLADALQVNDPKSVRSWPRRRNSSRTKRANAF